MEKVIMILVLIIGIAVLIFIVILILALMKVSGESDKDDLAILIEHQAKKGMIERERKAETILDKRRIKNSD